MTIEIEVANRLAHLDRIADRLARTGGELIHPDAYDFRMAFRDAALAGMDEASEAHGFPKVKDRDLPELFRALDAMAERLWLRKVGL